MVSGERRPRVVLTPSEQANTSVDLLLREHQASDPPISITMLKRVRAWLHTQDGTCVEIKLRPGENALRLIILAYIGWRQGLSVDRDKLLTYVIGRNSRRDFDTEQLSWSFDGAKKFLRQDINRAAKQLEEAGSPLQAPLDFFHNSEPGFYQLHESCRIIDLLEIDRHYATLQTARKQGLLDEKINGSLPSEVIVACEHIKNAYTGDFLQELLEKYPEEFGIWVREPVTVYRDKYLDALLTLATYESVTVYRDKYLDALLTLATYESALKK